MPPVLERFIPIDLNDLVMDLCQEPTMDKTQLEAFHGFAQRYISLFHAQFHRQVSVLQKGYAPFNPDRDTVCLPASRTPSMVDAKQALLEAIEESLIRANFTPLPEASINAALRKTSPHGVEVTVDFDDFEEMILYYRGSHSKTGFRRHWKTAFLRREAVEIPEYRRLFLLLMPKPLTQRAAEIAGQQGIPVKKALRKLQKSGNLLADRKEESAIYIKLFKEIPHSDLEMLFPNTHVRMRMFDKVKLTLTGGGGTIGGITATLSKLGAAANPVTAATAIAGLAGVLWRQVTKVFAQRTKYMAALARNLYFYSLDNNAGALAHLVELAEAEECKEAILAYFFLLTEAEKNHTEKTLDQRIEHYLVTRYEQQMDFEISDGLRKLEQAGLLLRHSGGTLSVQDVETANASLEASWLALLQETTG